MGESVASNYAINQGSLSHSNYAISFTGSNFAITPRPISVRAKDQTRIYGEANPTSGAVTLTAGSLVGSDALSTATVSAAATATATASAASTHGLTPSAQSFSSGSASNYAITYQDGLLTIGKASLTVSADAKGKIYGDANPTLTATVSGFKNGEDAATAGITGQASLSIVS